MDWQQVNEKTVNNTSRQEREKWKESWAMLVDQDQETRGKAMLLTLDLRGQLKTNNGLKGCGSYPKAKTGFSLQSLVNSSS